MRTGRVGSGSSEGSSTRALQSDRLGVALHGALRTLACMLPSRGLPLFALVLALGSIAAAAAAELPAVARPRASSAASPKGAGTAFFLKTADGADVVAVTTAHAFDLAGLAREPEIPFLLGASETRVSVASRLHAAPGRPFSATGSSLAEDYLLFALDLPLQGVRTLVPDTADPESLIDQRVRILGVARAPPHHEEDLYGTVRKVGKGRLEVELDVPPDLRGWGGAPVLRIPEGTVVGMLQAAWPENDQLRLGVGPISGVVAALAAPLDGGLGRPLAAFAPAEDAGGGAGKATPDLSSQLAIGSASRELPAEGALLGRAGVLSTEIRLEIEEPPDGAVLGDLTGAFVAGRALALLGEFRRFDVVLVLDTSGSTSQSSGADINANGVVGKTRGGGWLPFLSSTDPGDSILAAEIAAAREVLRSLDPRNTRVGVVTFAGTSQDFRDPGGGGIRIGPPTGPPALTEEGLTSDFERVDKALGHVLERGPAGNTNMGAGLRQAVRELKGYRGGLSTPDPESDKVVLFFTDGAPTAPYDPADVRSNTRSVLRAADIAARADIRVHSFAIGPDALQRPVAAVEIAYRTGGYFTPVRQPGDLVEVIENVSFANIESLTVRNLTTGETAREVRVQADGTFGALVPIRTGLNRLRVEVKASDGSAATAEVSVAHAEGVKPTRLPRELVALRNRLLEQRLISLKRGNLEAEREVAERTRKELLLQIQEERNAAQDRAQEQRKELELDAEEPLESGAIEPPDS